MPVTSVKFYYLNIILMRISLCNMIGTIVSLDLARLKLYGTVLVVIMVVQRSETLMVKVSQ